MPEKTTAETKKTGSAPQDETNRAVRWYIGGLIARLVLIVGALLALRHVAESLVK